LGGGEGEKVEEEGKDAVCGGGEGEEEEEEEQRVVVMVVAFRQEELLTKMGIFTVFAIFSFCQNENCMLWWEDVIQLICHLISHFGKHIYIYMLKLPPPPPPSSLPPSPLLLLLPPPPL